MGLTERETNREKQQKTADLKRELHFVTKKSKEKKKSFPLQSFKALKTSVPHLFCCSAGTGSELHKLRTHKILSLFKAKQKKQKKNGETNKLNILL